MSLVHNPAQDFTNQHLHHLQVGLGLCPSLSRSRTPRTSQQSYSISAKARIDQKISGFITARPATTHNPLKDRLDERPHAFDGKLRVIFT